jgi:hypothetical protein
MGSIRFFSKIRGDNREWTLFSGVNYTADKFVTGVVDTAEQFIADVVDTADKHSFAIILANFRKTK